MANAFTHLAIALAFALIAVAIPGHRLERRERRRTYLVVALFVALLLITIPDGIRGSSAGTVLLVLTILAGVATSVLLALSVLKPDMRTNSPHETKEGKR